MRYINFLLLIVLLADFFPQKISAQDTTNLINQLENETVKDKTVYTVATFKTTRIVDGQSSENLPRHVLDVRISHRFGPVSSGAYEFFGLDNATMRLGFDYGITDNFMIGIGHSTYQKTYDAFFKIRLLRQSTGAINMPVTISFVPVIAINTLKQFDSVKTIFSDRTSWAYQLLIARKFSEKFALQVMPTFIHADNISFNHSKQNILAMGIGGRHRISKRVNINAEYYYQLPDTKAPGSHNVFSFGVDIGTGGHVFQLHFTNSAGLTEKSFISETTGRWEKNNIMFGFNISRVFQLKEKH
ncbi:MAG TPA: DUF5777 family beta-barrel protein [Hanamia sp.]|nr:DUF5777 family beta-barrel protein [Hanamia sp.]